MIEKAPDKIMGTNTDGIHIMLINARDAETVDPKWNVNNIRHWDNDVYYYPIYMVSNWDKV
jgi:hypothetical protein